MNLISIIVITLFLAIGLSIPNSVDVHDNEWKMMTSDRSMNYHVDHTFHIALTQNMEGVQQLYRYMLDHISNVDSPKYGQYLSIDEINRYVGTCDSHYSKVREWLHNYNITTCYYYSDSIVCHDKIWKVNRLLDVDIKPFSNIKTKKIIYASHTGYTIPNHLQSSIEFIDGISNRLYPLLPSKIDMPSDNSVDKGSITREVLMRMYSLYPTFGKNVSVGAMEYQGGEGFSNKDLLISQMANGVPKNRVAKDHIIGVNNDPDGESQLDVQVMYWADSNAELWYEDFQGWMYQWAINFFNRQYVPEVVSLSWGWSEKQQCGEGIGHCNNSEKYVKRCNIEFMKIVARGTTMVVASGDAGSPGRTNEGCQTSEGKYGWDHINAVFPGGSPWVLSVGATYVIAGDGDFDYQTPICTDTPNVKCASGTSEGVTTYEKTGWTSGAGFTLWESRPIWQHTAVKKYLNSGVQLPNDKYYNRLGRAYPDVSAFGHNCMIHSGTWHNADGTSCSSPVFAGVITNLNAYQKSRGKPVLGFANPLLYRMYEDIPSTFNDVTIGNSTCTESYCCGPQYGFIAAKGWDPVAGLGTPNVEEMKRYLSIKT